MHGHGSLSPADWERVGKLAAFPAQEAMERAAVALLAAGRAEESRSVTDALASLLTLRAMARGKGCLTRAVIAASLLEAIEGLPAMKGA